MGKKAPFEMLEMCPMLVVGTKCDAGIKLRGDVVVGPMCEGKNGGARRGFTNKVFAKSASQSGEVTEQFDSKETGKDH